jgi:hypothetical protein
MAGGDVEVVLDWAAVEGWNPGLHDAAAFAAVDPEGLLLGLVNGEPIAAIACPRYDGRFGFVGLYLVRGDHRGSGLGMSIWRAGHARLGGIVAGLDAVDAQVGHYERWGYRAEGHTYRYAGRGPQRAPDADVCPLKDVPWSGVLDMDARGFPARRDRFLRLWTTQPEGRALALRSGGRVIGYGVRRRCREGYKVGPLFARDRRGAESLLDGLVSDLQASDPWWIDAPETNPAAIRMAEDRDLVRGLRTSRMYRGRAPDYERSTVFGVTTLELG